MKLTDLNPRWLGTPDGRDGVCVSFECPCGCTYEDGSRLRVAVHIDPPLDGGAPISTHTWQRAGATFEDLTLTPSIRVIKSYGCEWHGYVTAGEVTTC